MMSNVPPKGPWSIHDNGSCFVVKDKARHHFFHRIRKRIETTFSQLWRQMLDRVFSRSFLGLRNTLLLKMVHYNMKVAGILS